jgi:hypothetical protein
MDKTTNNKIPLCPSARPEWGDTIVFGVITGTKDEPNVTYLKESQPVTDELIELAKPVTPTEVFRIAGTCATNQCQHFDGANCSLAQRVVDKLPIIEANLPPCAIRRDCRWWLQEGKAACYRCPQVITDNYSPTELVREVAQPPIR